MPLTTRLVDTKGCSGSQRHSDRTTRSPNRLPHSSGYYGELTIVGDMTPRWVCWFLSMIFFCYIVFELLVGLASATNQETDETVRGKIKNAQLMTVVSWCTYPVVYLLPILKIGGANTIVAVQMGYCVSDIISKCGVGVLIYQI